MRILTFIIVFIIILSGLCNGTEWEIIGRLPIPVKGAQAITQNSLIYVIGGYSDSLYTDLNIIQIYNPETGQWTIAEDTISVTRYGHSANNYGESIIFFGGSKSEDLPAQGLEFWNQTSPPYFYTYNPNFSRDFSTSQIFQDDLYIFGGYSTLPPSDTSNIPYMVQYHIPSGEIIYEDMAFYTNENSPIHQMSVSYPPFIYLFGGSSFGITRDIVRYAIDSKEWFTLETPLFEERAGGQAVKINDQTFALIGGYNESSPALQSVETIELWSESYMNTQPAAPLNIARSEPAAVMLDSFIYVFGGCDVLGNCVAEVEKWLPDLNTTAVTEGNAYKRSDFRLYQNYPNPFNSSTLITISIQKVSQCHLDVFSIDGKFIKNITKGIINPGTHAFYWDGTDLRNIDVPSGLYFCRLTINEQVSAKRMLLVR